MILDRQSVSSGFIPAHKIKSKFLDFYDTYAVENRRYGSRHLASSLKHFKIFLKKDYISASNITEDLCERFTAYLLQKFNGETPANYLREFKRMMKSARKAGYFVKSL